MINIHEILKLVSLGNQTSILAGSLAQRVRPDSELTVVTYVNESGLRFTFFLITKSLSKYILDFFVVLQLLKDKKRVSGGPMVEIG